jgi:hypothetical protein
LFLFNGKAACFCLHPGHLLKLAGDFEIRAICTFYNRFLS